MTIDEAILYVKEKAESMENDILPPESIEGIEITKHNEMCQFYAGIYYQFARWLIGYKELLDIIEKIKATINTPNRGVSDYFIIDQIENIISKYENNKEKEKWTYVKLIQHIQ